jgi:hypothetical protein
MVTPVYLVYNSKRIHGGIYDLLLYEYIYVIKAGEVKTKEIKV